MGIIYCDSIDSLAVAEKNIPDLFQARATLSSFIVHGWVPIRDFQEAVPLYLGKFLGTKRPAEVWVIDVRNTLDLSNCVDISLNGTDESGGCTGF